METMTDEEINIAIAKEAGFSVFTPKIELYKPFPDCGYYIYNHQEVDKEICYMLAKSGIYKDYWGGREVVTFLLKDGLICLRSVTRKNELIAPGKNIPSYTRSEIPVHINRDFIRKEEYKNGFQVDDFAEYLPDYCKDLNAMHEAEKVLHGKGDWSYCIYDEHLFHMTSSWKWNATARQRAEAFLKTLNLWKQ